MLITRFTLLIFMAIRFPKRIILILRSVHLDNLSFAETDEISLAKACCACAEIMYSAQPDKQIASEKVGDYSISYSTTQTAVADELIKTASRYLNLRSVGWI